MQLPADWIAPQWPAPARVHAFVTTRNGGVSAAPYDTLNLGTRVGDDPQAVATNRARVEALLPAPPHWLHQVHGTRVIDVGTNTGAMESADAAFARAPRAVCVIQIADCMPVLLCDRSGHVVGGAHAGWRGLAGGVLESTIEAMSVEPADLIAWLGPAIGPTAFEVGDDVMTAFAERDEKARDAFKPLSPGKWLADLFALARLRLRRIGVTDVCGGEHCTYSEPARFFSHRRDKVSGRQAAFIWLER